MGFFKAYDMRGTYGVDFDLETVARVGAALPQVVPGSRWLVGRDMRASSPAVHAALVAGLRAAGVEVTDLGLSTTPMVYFFTAEDGYDGSVMVTASHNPAGDNGLKVSKRGALPVGYADGLDRVEALVRGTDLATPSVPPPTADSAPSAAHLARYIAWQQAHSTYDARRGTLNLAVDCSNGMASILAHALFPGAVFLNDTPDGTFPGHSPNPLKAEARAEIAAAVRERHLDAGLIFDGDADRCMFVDERGEFVQPDYLIPVIARATLSADTVLPLSPAAAAPAADTVLPLSPAAAAPAADTVLPLSPAAAAPAIVHDVRTSRGAIEAIRELGARPVMVPVGHAFAKPILRRTGAPCGGELAGHYYFKAFFGCDSGVLAATRVLGELAAAKARGETFSQMMAPIVSRYANSGELNFRVEDKDAAIARVLACAAAELPPERARETMDGIRLEFDDGWINVRKSNTEPYLRLLVECRDAAGPAAARAKLANWTDLLAAAISATTPGERN